MLLILCLCDPCRIQTCNPHIRSVVLYSVELMDPKITFFRKSAAKVLLFFDMCKFFCIFLHFFTKNLQSSIDVGLSRYHIIYISSIAFDGKVTIIEIRQTSHLVCLMVASLAELLRETTELNGFNGFRQFNLHSFHQFPRALRQ